MLEITIRCVPPCLAYETFAVRTADDAKAAIENILSRWIVREWRGICPSCQQSKRVIEKVLDSHPPQYPGRPTE